MNTKKKLFVVTGAALALCLLMGGVVSLRYARQYAVIDDFIAVNASKTGPLNKGDHTKAVCKNASGEAGHCRATQYAISGRQCITVSADLLGSSRCQSGKDVTFKGHTLHVSTGEVYPQTGTFLTVSYIR